MLVPASPNWFIAQCAATAADGTAAAFAARNSVVIVLLPSTKIGGRTHKNHNDVHGHCASAAGSGGRVYALEGHKGRVTAVSFVCGGSLGHAHLCFSASLDGAVRVWDWQAGECRRVLRLPRADEAATAVAASGAVDVVLSGSDAGGVFAWASLGGAADSQPCGASREAAVTAIAFSGAESTLAAVGYADGTLALVDAQARAVLATVTDAHGADVQALDWHRGLLATSARDRRVRVWKVDIAEEAYASRQNVTKPPQHNKRVTLVSDLELSSTKGRQSVQKSRTWVPLCWLPEGDAASATLLTVDPATGELLVWRDLPCDGSRQKGTPLRLAVMHSRPVFTLARVPSPEPATGVPRLFTVSMDRVAALWQVTPPSQDFLAKRVWHTVGLGGFGYSLAACPADPQVLAAGVGDNTIRLLRIPRGGAAAAEEGAAALASATLIHRGIGGKVTALAWHPFHAGCLAYGTDSGAVALYDCAAQRTVTFEGGKHPASVRFLSWVTVAPCVAAMLCSVGGGKAYAWHIKDRHVEGVMIPVNHGKPCSLIERHVGLDTTAMALWCGEGALSIALGGADGTMEVHCRASKKVLTIEQAERGGGYGFSNNSQKDGTVCMSWAGGGDGCLATAFVSGGILVVGKTTDGTFGNVRVWFKTFLSKKLKGKRDWPTLVTGDVRVPVPVLEWSPHDPRLLAVGMSSGTSAVWRVELEGEFLRAMCVARSEGHGARIQGLCWCIQTPGVVYTASEDQTLVAWDSDNAKGAAAAECSNAHLLARKAEAKAKLNAWRFTNERGKLQVHAEEESSATAPLPPNDSEEKFASGSSFAERVAISSSATVDAMVSHKSQSTSSGEMSALQRGPLRVQGSCRFGTRVAGPAKELFSSFDTSNAGRMTARAACVRQARVLATRQLQTAVQAGACAFQIDEQGLVGSLLALVETDAANSGATPSPLADAACGVLPDAYTALSLCHAREKAHLSSADSAACSGKAIDAAAFAQLAAHLAFWRGDLAAMEEALTGRSRGGLVGDFVAAGGAILGGCISPTAEVLIRAYAHEALARGESRRGSLLLIAIGDAYGACEALLALDQPLASVVLALLRLGPSQVAEVAERAAASLDSHEAYEHAAALYVTAGKLSSAASSLAKRLDIHALRAAASVLLVAPLSTVSNSMALLPILRHAAECIRQRQWEEADSSLGFWLSLPQGLSVLGSLGGVFSYMMPLISAVRYAVALWDAEHDAGADWGKAASGALPALDLAVDFCDSLRKSGTGGSILAVKGVLEDIWAAQFESTLPDGVPEHVIASARALIFALCAAESAEQYAIAAAAEMMCAGGVRSAMAMISDIVTKLGRTGLEASVVLSKVGHSALAKTGRARRADGLN